MILKQRGKPVDLDASKPSTSLVLSSVGFDDGRRAPGVPLTRT
jgi:hypothetical protein